MSAEKKQVHERQRRYVDSMKDQGFGITVAKAFVNSIRDLGYRNVCTAVDELIDNTIEAAAENVHVAFGYGKSNAKPAQLAVMDDGYGMVPEMVRASCMWGGTDRENSRDLFGRYGYGLPSSSVSQGKRFTVYSRVDSGDFYAVTMDLDDIAEGKYMVNNQVVVPEPAPAPLPEWVVKYADKQFAGGAPALSTVVVWDKLDRITWTTTKTLHREFLQHFGLVYRGFLRQLSIVVDGTKVEPIDPLFTTPGHRFYDYDEDRAEALPGLEFTVKGDDGTISTVRLRVSYMPPTFPRQDKGKQITSRGGNANPRFNIMKENNGLIVCRSGRQIDVVTRARDVTFQNNDRYIGLEIDFPPTLDEEFGVTTAKQQITISDRIWDHLRQHGFVRTKNDLSKRFKEDKGDLDVNADVGVVDAPRPSEEAMAEAKHIERPKPQSERRKSEADENLDREVKRIAEETGVAEEDIRDAKQEEFRSEPYKVVYERVPAGPFYRAEQRGAQVVLYVNKAHRFFTDIYSTVSGAPGARVRAALEVLLFVLAESELDSEAQGQVWYFSERTEWSNRLNTRLTLLSEHIDSSIDDLDPDFETADES